ncbi:hypothetical protein C8J57DRAFT_1255805 [Mycena rebaudengoi]|nr:hypothetical protein C8J57DRAFT_1255805 [Mycena rebaudengoi]
MTKAENKDSTTSATAHPPHLATIHELKEELFDSHQRYYELATANRELSQKTAHGRATHHGGDPSWEAKIEGLTVKNLSLKSAQELLQQIVVAPLPRADSKKNGSGIFGPAGERELTAEERKALSWAVAELADQSWRRSSRWSKARFQSLKFAEKSQDSPILNLIGQAGSEWGYLGLYGKSDFCDKLQGNQCTGRRLNNGDRSLDILKVVLFDSTEYDINAGDGQSGWISCQQPAIPRYRNARDRIARSRTKARY